jgi:3',5'-cyclic AMP phosphodiesterase CpdA
MKSAAAAPSLRFRRRGPFRIVQFTDTHFSHPRPQDRRTQALMEFVLDTERPDLVVLTGDIVSGWETPDASAAWRTAVAPMVQRGLSWAAVFGNHDDEGGHSRAQLLAAQRGWPGCLTQAGPANIGGVGNYVIPVFARHGGEPAALLYFLDSGAYSATGAGHYAWFTHAQVGWYRETSREWTRRTGRRLPALAFFHIPLPEFETAWREGYDKRGARNEPVCAPAINSGMFAAFHECGDVAGVFVGHDHVNDFEANLHGIRLCYGRASGYGAYGRPGFARGARVIDLTPGRRDFQTRVRLAVGRQPTRRRT